MQPAENLTQWDADSLCRVVSRIITVKEETTVFTRKFITEIYRMDGSVLRKTEFFEKGSPVKTVTEKTDLPTVQVVPLENVESQMDEEKVTGWHLHSFVSRSFLFLSLIYFLLNGYLAND